MPLPSSPYLKFAALGIVLAFAGVVGGLWATRAEPITDGARPADPLKERRAAPSAPPRHLVDGPVEARPLVQPEGVRDSGENALAAQAVASAALRDDPDNLKALGNLGTALLNLHEPAKALPLFEHAARLAPDQWTTQFNLARAQVQLGRWNDAVASLQSVRTMRPDDYTSSFNLALALHRSGDDERAIDEYRRAIALGPHDGSLFRSLGVSLQRSGRTADAVRAYQEYLRLVPDAADAEQINGRITALQASDRPAAPRQDPAAAATR
jgi:tetratricopeptide (TPR) repeat protein